MSDRFCSGKNGSIKFFFQYKFKCFYLIATAGFAHRFSSNTLLHPTGRPASQIYHCPYMPEPHALRGAAVRGRPLPGGARPVHPVPQGWLHLRLPGRARPLHVGRGMAGDDAPGGGKARGLGRGREHGCLGHHRLAGEERPEQRPGGGLGDLLPGLLRGGQPGRLPPRPQGGLAPGPGGRPLHGRRRLPQRRLLPGRELRLLRDVLLA